MVRGLVSAVRFLWRATKGYRLRPWTSPYLRWRMETYSGKKAETLRAKDFAELAWAERAQLWRFARWTGQMERIANGERVR